MSVYFKVKQAQLRLFWDKAKKEALKLAFAVVVAEFAIVICMAIALNYGFLELLKPKTIYITNRAEAETITEEIKEVKKPETTKEIIARIAEEKGFEDVDILLKLAECESGFDRYAKNGVSSARGLYQILDMHGLSEDERYNPEVATSWTIDKIRKDGLKAWTASKHCWGI